MAAARVGRRMTKTPLHLGHLGMFDAAPLLVARELGYFAAEGLDVTLTCALGLSTLGGKLAEQRFDGASLPAPHAVLLSLGIIGPRAPLQAVAITSYQGLALVLGPRATERGGAAGAAGAAPRIGISAPVSPARLFLQRLQQVAPQPALADATFVPLASGQLIDFLHEHMIDGFFGPDPLPALAEAQGQARVVADSAKLFPQHPGSVAALRLELAQSSPRLVAALATSLQRAAEFCADPANHETVWRLVSAQCAFADVPVGVRHALGSAKVREQMSTRFLPAPGAAAGLGATGEAYLENACRSAIPNGTRGPDLKAEMLRIFQPLAARAGAALTTRR